MQENDFSDLACVDPGFQVGEAQPHDPLKGDARDARRLHGLDHSIGLADVHRHRLAEDDVLPRHGGPDRQIRELRDGSSQVDDVDAFPLEQFVVVAVTCDAERAGERVQLRLVVPRRGDELRPGILPQRPCQTVRRIPVPQSKDGHAPLTAIVHDSAPRSTPAPT